MLDIDIAYPEFVPNQILTDKQLNQLHTHLEQEDRVTRLHLAGTGIVCGLRGRKTASGGVEIDAGYGITSDGDLIDLCEKTTYTHFRNTPYADPDRDEQQKLKYAPWQGHEIVELIPAGAAPEVQPPDTTAFTDANFGPKVSGRVLVLYLEHAPVDLKSCLVTSCDNKGRNVNVHVRALLVKKTDLTAVQRVNDCRPTGEFPRHLMLGVLDGTDGTAYHNEFSAAPLRDAMQDELRTRLAQQDRITRLRLSGMGIVCGLHARKGATSVEIDPGYGITSDGDVIELCDKTTYTHFRNTAYADPDKDEQQAVKYAPWRGRDIVELIPVTPPAAPPTDATAFTAANLATKVAGRVLVLYLEREPAKVTCMVSCDSKVRVRALLVPKAALTALTDSRPLPAFRRIPRLFTKHALQPGSTANHIAGAFRAIVNDHVAAVGTNIKTLFDTYGPFLNLPSFAANPLDNKLTNAAHIAQYQHDALLDFAAACNEASAGAYALMKECCPAGSFPRHLMLGGLDTSVEPGFRNEFSPAPLRNVMYGEIDRVRDLFKRLNAMIDVNVAAALPGITIRPSHTAAFPLGRRARPFYFASAGIDALWRPRARWTVDGDWPWLNAPPVPTGLSTDYAESTWLRIEGDLARNANTVLAEITAARDAANAEFDVFCSYLDAEAGAADENAARTAVKIELARPLPAWDKARDAVTNWVTTPPADLGSIVALAGDQIRQLAAIDKASAGWVAVRGRRVLHCEVSALAADYLQARGELMCLGARVIAICARIRTNLARLSDKNLTAQGLEHMLDGAPFLLVDSVMASILASPDEWDAEADVKQKLAWTAAAPVGADAAVRALTFQLLAIEAGVQRLLAAGIPKQLAAFDVEVFAARLRPVVLQLLTVYLWMQAAGVRLTASDKETKDREVSFHGSEDALLRSDLLALRGCLLTRFATIAAIYDAMRDADLSLFRNLATIDGLEHLAGVAKGGTFVLVAESPGTPNVVADFSLEGRLPCCCEIRPPFCLPLIATPDARVIRIPRKGDAVLDIDVDINVVANDYDLNRWPATAKLDLLSPTSERGAKLKAGDKGFVTYQLDSKLATPGLVDRFSYRLRVEGECAGDSIGDVIVILAVDPMLTGRIAGEVVTADVGASGEGATVTLIEANATTTARTKGRFEFELLPPRQYSLQAVRGALRSDVVTTQVEVDGTATPTLMLKAMVTVGTIIIRARDTSGAAIPGVSIISTNTTTGAVRTATTGADGAASLPNLPAGPYNVRATLGGFAAAQIPPIVLVAGATELRDVVLRQARPVIPDLVITNLSTIGRIGVLDAAKRVRKTMTDRYAKWNVSLNNASDDPAVLGSDPYAKAITFVTETLTDPQTNAAAVATTYRDTSNVLAEAAKNAAGDAKAGYQKALMAVTAAYMDRVAASSPATVTPDAERQMKLAGAALRKAGVTADAMTTQWEASVLTDGAGVQNTDNFVRLLR